MRFVKINEHGLPVGEDHHNAKLTDREVDRLREMHEAGYSYRQLAEMFELSKSSVRDIIKCRRRAQTVAGTRVVCVPGE